MTHALLFTFHRESRSRHCGWSLAAALWALPVSCGMAFAQQQAVITGTIEDAVSGNPVTMATLSLNGGVAALTDRDGRFRIEGVEWGTNVIRVRRIGYSAVEIDVWVDRPNAELELVIDLAPAPTALDPISVEGEATPANRKLIGFEERRKLGFGHFVTTEQIEAWNPSRLTDVLQKAPGVRVLPNPTYGLPDPKTGRPDYRRYIIGSWRRASSWEGSGSCEVTFYLDGMYLGKQDDVPIDSWLNIGSLAAVEIYSGPSQIPARFNRVGSQCGVVVLWTR